MPQAPPISAEDQQDISEILRKIRKIELKTRGLVRESIGGEYHNCFKGEGIDFEDFREYQHGDEVRSIDWNVTARMRKPYIKKFTEQRELTMILAVDISASGNYGSHEQSKRELIAEVSALLAFSALQNKDKVGLILFTDQIEKYVPPAKRCVAHLAPDPGNPLLPPHPAPDAIGRYGGHSEKSHQTSRPRFSDI